MDTALPLLDISIDSPWFVNVAAEPLLQLLELYPHLNVTALAYSPPPDPFRLNLNHLERRDNCYNNNNTNGNSSSSSSGPSGALIGGIVAGVVVVLLLLILAWFFWRRNKTRKAQQQQQQQQPPFVNNNVGVQPPMPMPYDPTGMNSGTPPIMQQTGGYDVNQGGGIGPNYTSAVYPAPPSTSGGWSSSNTNTGSAAGLLAGGGTPSPKPQDRQSYYNYAPPPVETIPGVFSVGTTAQFNHNSTLGPGGGTMYSGTPSPPPPSTTPGASSISGYAPWAIPHSTSPGPASSTVGPSSSAGSPPPGAQAAFGGFPTAADEKAHYSGLGEKNPAGFPNFPTKEGQGSGGDDALGTSPPARMAVQTPAPPAYSAYTGQPQQ